MNPSANSVNNIPIRLTDERWRHIVENRDELAGYFYDVLEVIGAPDYVIEGTTDELWAIKFVSNKKALVVIYKEDSNKTDGFIITAFFTTKVKKLLKRKILWEKQH